MLSVTPLCLLRPIVLLTAALALPTAFAGTARAEEPDDDEVQEEAPSEEGPTSEAPAGEQPPPGGDAPKPGGDDGAQPGLDAAAIVVTFDGGVVDAGLAGEDAPRFSEIYHLNQGRISNWSQFEQLLERVFQMLGVSPSDHPVILSETVAVPAAEREKLTQLMFEKFNVPAFYLSVDGVLACYASGRTTCLVVSGQDATDVLAVYDGYALPHSRMGTAVGRVEIARYAMKLIGDRTGKALAQGDREGVWQLLEQHGYVAPDFDAELQKAASGPELEVSVTLPGGHSATLGAERFRPAEALFKPSLVGLEQGGVHNAVYDAIMKCDVDVRADLFGNIVLAGRAVSLDGMAERLTKEVAALAPPTLRVNVVAPAERARSVWIGGSIVSSMPTFKQRWVSRKDYDTSGPAIIGNKAF